MHQTHVLVSCITQCHVVLMAGELDIPTEQNPEKSYLWLQNGGMIAHLSIYASIYVFFSSAIIYGGH